jgi:LDH2 family malate/lactate/ureidoglycolate dehydrogenase
MSTVRIEAEALRQYARDIMLACGVDTEQSAVVADNLVWSDMIGRATHGVARLPIHMARVRRGLLNCPCQPHFEPLAAGLGLLDGDRGFGHFVGEMAMSRAIDLARREGVGIVGVRNSNFFGIGARYVHQAAQAGMIGVAMSNSTPNVAAHNGLQPVLGTNPLAFGAPRASGRTIMVDMATSALASSKVREMAERGEALPVGLAIDASGAPVTDPAKVSGSTLLPFAGAKGFGLALAVEILCGVLTGAGVSHGVASLYKNFSASGDNGHFMLAIDISRFMPLDVFHARLDSLAMTVEASAPPGRVRLPGEARWQEFENSKRLGVPVATSTLDALDALAKPQGIAPPKRFAGDSPVDNMDHTR